MRILYLTEESIDVSGTMVRGGAIHVAKVVRALRDRGHTVGLLDWNTESSGERRGSVRPATRFVDGPVRTCRTAVGLGREMDAEVLVSKTRKTYLPGLLAARLLGVPHVAHVGTTLDAPRGAGLLDRLDSRSFELRLRAGHDGYLVVCEYIGDQLRSRGVEEDRIFNVRNAVDTSVFDPNGSGPLPSSIAAAFETERLVVGFVGGLHDYKGVHDLVDAVQLAESDILVAFVGDGPERDALQKRLEDGTGALIGAVPYESMPAVYGAMDVLALPSHTEGLPRVVLEGQAMRTPVVATRVGGVPEVVTDGETGLLCPPGRPRKMAAALDRLATERGLRNSLAGSGRERVVREFTWESLYDEYESALRSLVGGC